MLKNKLKDLIKDLNSKIYQKYPAFKGCYLYGSTLKGTSHKHSDIDLVAIFEKDLELSGIICDLMYKYDVYIDLSPYTVEKLKNNPVYYNEVVNKGQFYEAA